MYLRPSKWDPLSGQAAQVLVDSVNRYWLLGSKGLTASVFIPLPSPIPLPDGLQRGWSGAAMPPREGFDLTEQLGDLLEDGVYIVGRQLGSMCVRQIEQPWDSRMTETLWAAAEKAFPRLKPGDTSALAMPTVLTTVIEATGVVESRNPDSLSNFIDSALEGVRRLQLAFGSATGTTQKPVTLERLPPLIPVHLRPLGANPGETVPDGTLMIANSAVPRHTEGWEPVSEAVIEKMDGMAHQIGMEAPFMTSGLRLNEAIRHIDDEGETWVAIALLGTACEVLFDELLAVLLWESGARPEECVQHFDLTITKRVGRGELGRLLPGDWRVDAKTPVGEWNRAVARVRNEVLHGGREPSRSEVRAARTASIELEVELRRRVVQSIADFPRTAWLLAGSNHLDQSLRRKHVDPLLEQPGEVDWKLAAASWRRIVTYASRYGRWRAESAVPADLELFAVIHPCGSWVWVVADTSCERAFSLSGKPEWFALDGDLEADLEARSRAGNRILSMHVPTAGPLPARGDWKPLYRLLPEHPVLVDGERVDPPS